MIALRKEELRLQALTQLKLLDTPPSESFDRITRMASRVFGLPIAAVSLTDIDRQWFKSRVGVDPTQLPRTKAPCAEVTDTLGAVIIPDLLANDFYRDSPVAQSGARFYAGHPLITREGFALGAMCVLGSKPGQFAADEQQLLRDLAAMVVAQIELQHALGRIDPVSGLANRYQLLEDLQDEARDEAGARRSIVLAEIMETHRLSSVTRVLGPAVVDDLVRSAARTFEATLRADVKIYQVGPVHFAWLREHESEEESDATLSSLSELVTKSLAGQILAGPVDPSLALRPFAWARSTRMTSFERLTVRCKKRGS